MTRSLTGLTELEGAILTEMRRIGVCTAYQLRQLFIASPSEEWSGSAGAVYPAIRRLAKANLVSSNRIKDGRGTARLTLTKAGDEALTDWALDIARAIGPGMDPFRSRAAMWITLTKVERRALARKLAAVVRARQATLEVEMKTLNEMGRARIELEIELQTARLRWLAAGMK